MPIIISAELGMFDDAANALEQIESEDKTRNEVLYARVEEKKLWRCGLRGRGASFRMCRLRGL